MPETVGLFDDVEKRLRTAGANVQSVALPAEFSRLAAAQITIMVREVAESLSHERRAHAELLSREMIAMIDAGLAVTPAQYDAATALARQCRAMLSQVFDGFDVLVAPSTTGEAPAGIEATGDPLFNRIGRCYGCRSFTSRLHAVRRDCRSASRSWVRLHAIAKRCSARTGSTRSFERAFGDARTVAR